MSCHTVFKSLLRVAYEPHTYFRSSLLSLLPCSSLLEPKKRDALAGYRLFFWRDITSRHTWSLIHNDWLITLCRWGAIFLFFTHFLLKNAIFVVSARFRKDFSRCFILLIAYLQGFEVSWCEVIIKLRYSQLTLAFFRECFADWSSRSGTPPALYVTFQPFCAEGLCYVLSYC